MVQILMSLLRVLVGLLLACAAVFSLLAGLYFLARQGAQVFGSEGLLLLVGVAAAAGFGVGSWRLFHGAFQTRAATA